MESEQKQSWNERFVGAIIQKVNADKGVRARLRKAQSPACEYEAWEILISLGVDVSNAQQCLAFLTIAVALATSKNVHNGKLSLGQALALCYEDKSNSVSAKLKLRRLLACDSLAEVTEVLRSILALIASRLPHEINYVELLKQLRAFPFHARDVKAQWAMAFYGKKNAHQEAP